MYILLFFIILAFGLAVSWWSLTENSAGEKAVVTVDSRLYGTYPLSEDQTVEIIQENGHHNDITIKDGQVSMSYSTCRNQVCVNTGASSQTKDAIVCLPNRVVVEIISSDSGSIGKGGDADVISG